MNNEQWIAYATAVCDELGVEHDLIEIITTWEQTFTDSENFRNNAVFRVDDRYCLKIFGPHYGRSYHVERAMLGALRLAEGIPTPSLVVAADRVVWGEFERPCLVMTQIAGQSAELCWDDLTRPEQLAVAREIGVISAAVHRLPYDDLAEVERQYGGQAEEMARQRAGRIEEIKATQTLTMTQRNNLLEFLDGEALAMVHERTVLTHNDLSHAHVFLARQEGKVWVSGFIDWGEGMLGPPEWDLGCHWFWTFSQDKEAMVACLRGYVGNGRLPERFARRCFGTFLYTYSMGLLWEDFGDDPGTVEDVVRDATRAFFPEVVFGPPD